jgi:lipopolysaccharide export system permease protein
MDFVYRSDAGYTLAARRLTLLDSRLTGVVVQQLGDGNEIPTIHIEATEAEHTAEAGWTFLDGYLRLVRNDGPESAYHFDRMRLPALTEVPAELLDTPPEEDEMTSAELERMARVVERSGGKPHRLRVKKDQRVAIPAATLVIILFGMPLATSSKRGGTAYGIGAALGTTIVYLLLFKVVGSFGESGVIRPDLAAWSPNILFLLAGLFLMARVRT